jgi:predicted MPP superfamily phosphohydrolase
MGSRRAFVRNVGSAGILGIMGAAAYGVYRQSTAPVARRVRVSYPWLPRELHGFRIAHLTDPHLGLWANERELRISVAEAAAERADMVIFTGDMVDRRPELAGLYGGPVAKHMAKVPFGVWGVLGNHDHFSNPDRIGELLTASGIRVLREERVNVPGLPMSLTGLDDQGIRGGFRRRPDVDQDALDILDFSKVAGPPGRPGDFRVLLNHRPEGYRQAAQAGGYHLFLAGHTHGGQYAVPWHRRSNMGSHLWKYTTGLYREWGSRLNVSAGLASVGVPFRLGAWPEFSVVTLERGPDDGYPGAAPPGAPGGAPGPAGA